jgi:hypothetical protein
MAYDLGKITETLVGGVVAVKVMEVGFGAMEKATKGSRRKKGSKKSNSIWF